jgi:hypothetical protein
MLNEKMSSSFEVDVSQIINKYRLNEQRQEQAQYQIFKSIIFDLNAMQRNWWRTSTFAVHTLDTSSRFFNTFITNSNSLSSKGIFKDIRESSLNELKDACKSLFTGVDEIYLDINASSMNRKLAFQNSLLVYGLDGLEKTRTTLLFLIDIFYSEVVVNFVFKMFINN